MTEIKSTVLEYIHNNFSSPFYLKTNKYEVGTILFTANPYLRTNATIIEVLIEGSMFQVLTDIGNVINQHISELEKSYLPPVCKRTDSSPPEDNLDYFSFKPYLNFNE